MTRFRNIFSLRSARGAALSQGPAGATVHNIGLTAWEKGAVDFNVLVKESLQLLLHKDNLPLLLSCSSGVSQTGVVVGCLRRMQVWTLASIFAEYLPRHSLALSAATAVPANPRLGTDFSQEI